MHDLELIMRGLNDLGNTNAVLEPTDSGPRISFKATSKSNFFFGFYKKSRIPLEMMNSWRFCCKFKKFSQKSFMLNSLCSEIFWLCIHSTMGLSVKAIAPTSHWNFLTFLECFYMIGNCKFQKSLETI